ncbi:hypothetical protein B481_1318 [Planococcus halocryophilus Or1]|uniref:Uncharacterized protein n=1 Tax=Planococcus halocryophilus TaxID=1215089 RepID=A0A1C7DMM3_9BACL|nr:hypothetical protein [Planococcus halocryophilus]ANU12642.1 hypothetical protein BBI08_01800 [Planococcus halocryophilus]EMF47156.1 hypothetical protein B481_1318 [Planococcus halocryophilus Or1]
MKYSQREFSLELKELIKDTEQSFCAYNKVLLNEYGSIFTNINKKLVLELKKLGKDPFEPNFYSFVSVEIELDKITKVKIEVPIWKTKAYFKGIPLPQNIPGGQVFGKLITLEVAKDVMKEFIEDNSK